MKYLYLHGLGQKPNSWDRTIKETKVSDSSISLSFAEMLKGKKATYRELYAAFSEECDKEVEESSCADSRWGLFWHFTTR